MLNELNKFKFQTISVLDYKKKKNHKIKLLKLLHSSAKPIASDSDTDEAVKSIHQSIITKRKYYASKNWIVLAVTIRHSIKTFECKYKGNK